MAFAAEDLHKVGGGVKSLYMYESADAVGTIAGSGYFNSATNSLKQDDVIIAVGATGGTRTVDVLVVTSASGAATVTTTNGT
jgi:DNA-binding MurR/RpiR family transcriptional regulator